MIGALLARSWHLPTALHDAIWRHHDPDVFQSECDDAVKSMIALSHLAGHIESQYSRNTEDGEWPRFAEPALTWLMLGNTELDELGAEVASFLLESGK
jgi:HD-like signal output (HDOD) protein